VLNKYSGALLAVLFSASANTQAAYALQTYQTVPTAPTLYNAYTQVGDFTGDAKNDILTMGTNESLSLLARSGSGFSESTIFNCAANGVSCQGPRVADFNNDGIMDVAYDEYDGTVKIGILIANGGGSFQHSSMLQPSYLCQTSNTGDINADGNIDLILLCGTASGFEYRLMVGDGLGHFADGPVLLNYHGQLKIADWNGDGTADLILLVGTNNGGTGAEVRILLNDGFGAFTLSKTQAFTVGAEYNSLAVADFNGDSILDLAVTAEIFYPETRKEIQVYTRNADGSFNAAQALPTQQLPVGLAATDLNNDGYADLIVAHRGNSQIGHYLNNAGSFGTEVINATGFAAADALNDRSFGDLNGDGCKDVALYENTVGVNVLYGQCGSPTSQSTKVRFNLKPSQVGLVLSLRNLDKRGLEFTGIVRINITIADPRVMPSTIPTGCAQSGFVAGTWKYDCLATSVGGLSNKYYGFGFSSTGDVRATRIKLDATVEASGVVLDSISRRILVSLNAY
jgi:FG-GAP-like repeat